MTLADDGSDGALEAGLRTASDALWQGLLEAARTYLAEPPASQARWVRPEPVRSELPGEETVSFQLGYPVYSSTVNRIVALFSEVGVVCPFDWPDWDGRDRYRGGAGLAAAPVADAVRLATTYVRGEKFCDGAIGGAIEDGSFEAILERIIRWYETERSPQVLKSWPDDSRDEDTYDHRDDLRYRYRFDRRWGPDEQGGRIVWVGLNPRTADTEGKPRRRPTLGRMVAWSQRWNASALTIVNLFAWRSTDPKALRVAVDPIGPHNDAAIADAVAGAARVILCWGNDGRLHGRGRIVADMLPGSLCLGTTAKGEPRHPLYVPMSAEPIRYERS